MADDTTLLIKCKKIANPINESGIHHMSKYFVDNKSAVNVEKCEAVFFGVKATAQCLLIEKN